MYFLVAFVLVCVDVMVMSSANFEFDVMRMCDFYMLYRLGVP